MDRFIAVCPQHAMHRWVQGTHKSRIVTGMQESSGEFMLAFPHVVPAMYFCLEVRGLLYCIA